MTNTREKPSLSKNELERINVKIQVRTFYIGSHVETAEYKTTDFKTFYKCFNLTVNKAMENIPTIDFLKIKAKLKNACEELKNLITNIEEFEPNPLNDDTYHVYKRDLGDALILIENKIQLIFNLIDMNNPYSFDILDSNL